MPDIIKILVGSALGAGIVVSLVQYSLSMRKERWQRKRDFLLQQLQLYGPAHSLACRLLHAEKRIDELWQAKQEYEQQQLAVPGHPAQELQERWREIPLKVHERAEQHRRKIMCNCGKLYKILSENLHFLDWDDVELARQFFEDYSIGTVEDRADAAKALPGEIQAKLEPYHFIRPEFARKIEDKFEAKQRKFARMAEPPGTVIAWLKQLAVKVRKRH